jgi:hypothetical protein
MCACMCVFSLVALLQGKKYTQACQSCRSDGSMVISGDKGGTEAGEWFGLGGVSC